MTDRQGQAGRAWGEQTDRQNRDDRCFLLLAGPALPSPGEDLPLLRSLCPFFQGVLQEHPQGRHGPLQPAPPCTTYTRGHSEPVSWSAQQGHYANQGAAWGQNAPAGGLEYSVGKPA